MSTATENDFIVRAARSGDFPNVVKLVDATATSAIAGAVYVAEATETGEILGMIVVDDLKNDAIRVDHLYVHHDHRRLGIGSALLERAIGHAKKNGAAALELVVDRGNPAQILYRKFGFETSVTTMRLTLQRSRTW